MMNSAIDVLEPIKDEIYFSWIFRLIVFNSSTNSTNGYYKTAKNIRFSKTNMPDLFWPDNIEEIINHNIMYRNNCLSSLSDFIEEMTNIPFYMNLILGGNKKFETIDEYKKFFRDNIDSVFHNYPKAKQAIVFCPECMKEYDFPVFFKEHQIVGNKTCWKHGCELQYVCYEKTGEFIASLINKSLFDTSYSFNLNPKQLKFEQVVSREIHKIYDVGFQHDLDQVYEKIRHKLLAENKIIAIRQYSFFDCLALKLHVPKNLEGLCLNSYENKFTILFETIFFNKSFQYFPVCDPVFIVFCICALFGNLYNMETYMIIEENLPYLNTTDRYHTLNFYEDTLSDCFFYEFEVIGTYKDFILVKHKRCGRVQKIDIGELSSVSCKFCGAMTERFVRSPERVFSRRKFINAWLFKRENGFHEKHLEFLTKNNLIDYIPLFCDKSVYPADFFITKEIKFELYKKFNLYKDEFDDEFADMLRFEKANKLKEKYSIIYDLFLEAQKELETSKVKKCTMMNCFREVSLKTNYSVGYIRNIVYGMRKRLYDHEES